MNDKCLFYREHGKCASDRCVLDYMDNDSNSYQNYFSPACEVDVTTRALVRALEKTSGTKILPCQSEYDTLADLSVKFVLDSDFNYDSIKNSAVQLELTPEQLKQIMQDAFQSLRYSESCIDMILDKARNTP